MPLQTDGGYLGDDTTTFFSAVISGAAGVYVGMLLQDADISTDLTIRPGQSVKVDGDTSLASPPLWGSGMFVVQERGTLSLTYVTLGAAVSALNGGSASVTAAVVPIRVLRECQYSVSGVGSTLQLSGVTVPDSPADWGEVTATVTVQDGDTVVDPPNAFTNPHVSQAASSLLLYSTQAGARMNLAGDLTLPSRTAGNTDVRCELWSMHCHWRWHVLSLGELPKQLWPQRALCDHSLWGRLRPRDHV